MARTSTKQSDLAAALSMSQAAVSRRLSGAVDFSISELLVVADTLGVTVSSLLPTRNAA